MLAVQLPAAQQREREAVLLSFSTDRSILWSLKRPPPWARRMDASAAARFARARSFAVSSDFFVGRSMVMLVGPRRGLPRSGVHRGAAGSIDGWMD